MIWGAGAQSLLAPAQLPALTLGVRSQWGHQLGQSLPRQVRGPQSIAAQPLPGGHSLSEKRTGFHLSALDQREQARAQGHTAGWSCTSARIWTS